MTMLWSSEMTRYRRRHSYAFILTCAGNSPRASDQGLYWGRWQHSKLQATFLSTAPCNAHPLCGQQTNIFCSLNFDITFQTHTTEVSSKLVYILFAPRGNHLNYHKRQNTKKPSTNPNSKTAITIANDIMRSTATPAKSNGIHRFYTRRASIERGIILLSPRETRKRVSWTGYSS